MKTIFDQNDYSELVNRINQLSDESKRGWGKMDQAQMLAHCSAALEMALGDVVFKRKLIGYIIGPLVKKSYLSDKPFSKDSPTAPEIIISDKRDLDNERKKILQLVKRMHEGGEKGATKNPHSFFGTLTPTQWGETQWKHLDHHLRQFGV